MSNEVEILMRGDVNSAEVGSLFQTVLNRELVAKPYAFGATEYLGVNITVGDPDLVDTPEHDLSTFNVGVLLARRKWICGTRDPHPLLVNLGLAIMEELAEKFPRVDLLVYESSGLEIARIFRKCST